MLFFWFFKNCELIRDSSLWRLNFIPLVHDSIIIIGSRSVVYTFDLRFTYKRWVRVLSKIWILAFLGKYSNIFVRSQNVSIEVRIIFQYCLLGLNACRLRFASFGIRAQVLKSVFYPFYLLFPVIIRKKKNVKKKKRYGNYWKHCGRFNWGQIWGWVHNSQSLSLSWFVENDYTICWFSWNRKF